MKRSSSPLMLDDSPHAGGAPESPAPSHGPSSPAAGQTHLSYSVPANTGMNTMVASNVPVQYPPSSTSNSPSHAHSHSASTSTTATSTTIAASTTNAANIIYGLEAQLSELRETLTRQVRVLTARHDDLRLEHVALKKAYENTERELEMFRHTTKDQDVLIRQLAGWFSIQREYRFPFLPLGHILYCHIGRELTTREIITSDTTRIPATPGGSGGGPTAAQGQLPAPSTVSSSQPQSQTSIPPKRQQQLLAQQSQSQSPTLNTQAATAPAPLPTAETETEATQLPTVPSSSVEPAIGADAFLQTHEAARMVAPPFRVTNNYLNSANAHIATAVLSNGADEHSLAEISLRRMNLMSERAMQAGMQFSMVTSTSVPQPQQPGGQVQGTVTADAAAGGTTTTTIPVTEPKPVLVGMTREVALQRLQDLARVSSSDLTGVAGSKSGAPRSLQPKSPTRTKREEGRGDDQGGRASETSSDGGSDDDGGPRVYASQHTQRIPTGAGLKARNFTASNSAPTMSPTAPTPSTLMPMPRGAGGTLTQGDNYRGLSVLTVGHLVPRPYLPDDGSASGMPMSAVGNGPSNTGAGASAGAGGPSGWPIVMSNGGPAPGVPGVGIGAIDPMYRIPSPPAASPPSLSATDPRPLVHAYPPPTSPPPSLSVSIPSGPSSGGGGGNMSPKQSKLRVRRSTYVPGWAVPPRVLLVEDDLVSRRLSSKFLQVSGCEIGVAVDGFGAVSKMELEKYDLVLMVRLFSVLRIFMRTTLMDGRIMSLLGYCHAQIGWDQCDEHDSEI